MKKEKKDPGRTSGEDPSPERIDGRSGLDRLEELTRKIIRVPKDEVAEPPRRSG